MYSKDMSGGRFNLVLSPITAFSFVDVLVLNPVHSDCEDGKEFMGLNPGEFGWNSAHSRSWQCCVEISRPRRRKDRSHLEERGEEMRVGLAKSRWKVSASFLRRVLEDGRRKWWADDGKRRVAKYAPFASSPKTRSDAVSYQASCISNEQLARARNLR